MQTKFRAGPPQIIRLDFHPSEFTTSRWLLHEMKKAGSWLPFISTTGGWRSNPSGGLAAGLGSSRSVMTALAECALALADIPFAPATAHAAGLEIPAFMSAAAIFCCCDIALADTAAVSLDSLTTSV